MKHHRAVIILASLGLLYLPTAMANSIQINQVLKTNYCWNGAPLPFFNAGPSEFTVMSFTIPPGQKTPIHIHPLNGVGFMLSGELTMYATDDPHGSFNNSKNVKKINIASGEAWTETVNTWHYGENLGKGDAKFIVVFAGQKGSSPTLSLQQTK